MQTVSICRNTCRNGKQSILCLDLQQTVKLGDIGQLLKLFHKQTPVHIISTQHAHDKLIPF